MSKEQFVELTIQIPKPVMDFFEAYWKFVGYTDETAKEYLTEHTSRNLPSLIYDMVFSNITDDSEQIIERHGLEPYRQLMGFPKHKETEANE